MIKRIDHIGIAVSSLENTKQIWRESFGLEVGPTEYNEEGKVKEVLVRVGDITLHLMETTDPEGPLSKFLAKRGEGVHHLALEVNDIRDTLETLEKKGVQLIDREPRTGVGGTSIAFLHPRETRVLIELVEPRK